MRKRHAPPKRLTPKGQTTVNDEERPMFLLGPLAAVLRWLEALANLLSGPLLAVGAIIAVIDLTTDGRLTASYPPLLYLFAISQAVGVESQLMGAWDRARAALVHRRYWGLLGHVLLGVLLAVIVYVGLYAFLGEQSFHMTTTQALAALGVSARFWLFLRAGIAIFLVALSAWTRYRTPRQTSLEDERARLQRELELEPLRQRLRHTRLAGVRDAASALLRSPDLPDASDTPDPTHTNTPAHATGPSVAPVAATQEGAGMGDLRGDAETPVAASGAAGEAVVMAVASSASGPDDEPPTPPPAPTRPTRPARRAGKATAQASSNASSNGHTHDAKTLSLVPLHLPAPSDPGDSDPPDGAAHASTYPRVVHTPAQGRRRAPRRPLPSYENAARKAWADGAQSIDRMQRATGMSHSAAQAWVRTLKTEHAAQTPQIPSYEVYKGHEESSEVL